MAAAKKQKMKPAAIFLLIIAAIVIAVIIGGIWLGANPEKALRIAFVPSHSFTEDNPSPQLEYAQNESWAALPSAPSTTHALPEGVSKITQVPEVDVFFVHPTTYLSRDHWNAPTPSPDADALLENRSLQGQASSFNMAGQIYAPRYRQATFGAFLDDSGNGLAAIALAYTDIVAAFDEFIANRNQGRPFILAGHSQGSLHLLYLLKDRITGTPLLDNMVAAYIIGWPVALETDLPALPDIPACSGPEKTGCIVSFQTFGLNGDASGYQDYLNATIGLNGASRAGNTMLCTNPINWLLDKKADKSEHMGAVTLNVEPNTPLAAPQNTLTGANCGDDGILYLTDPLGKEWQELKMTGENYHVYDYRLFYMSIMENAALRSHVWLNRNK